MSDSENFAPDPMDAASPAPRRSRRVLILAAVLLLLALAGGLVWVLRPKTATVWLCTQARSLDSSGTLVARNEYSYDDAGALLNVQFYDAGGEPDGRQSCTYREGANGEITQHYELYQVDGEPTTWIEYTYDRAGRMLSMRYNLNGGADAEFREENSYDAKGQLVSQQYYDADGQPRNRTEWAYDGNGNQTREQYYDQNGAPGDWAEHTFDAKGNELGWQYYRADGSLSDHMVYTYDSQGNRIREEYHLDGKQLSSYTEYVYDSDGNQTQKQEYQADGTVRGWARYAYDEAGNQILRQEDLDGDGKTDIWMESTYEAFTVPQDSLAAKVAALKG